MGHSTLKNPPVVTGYDFIASIAIHDQLVALLRRCPSGATRGQAVSVVNPSIEIIKAVHALDDVHLLGGDSDIARRGRDVRADLPVRLAGVDSHAAFDAAHGARCCRGALAFGVSVLLAAAVSDAKPAATQEAGFFFLEERGAAAGVAGRFYGDVIACPECCCAVAESGKLLIRPCEV